MEIVTNFDKNRTYYEVCQTIRCKFSFVNRKDTKLYVMFQPVLCRDFLGDVLWAEEQQKPIEIYKFRYDPAEQAIDRDKTRFVIFDFSQEEKECLKNNYKILYGIEKELGYTPTQVTDLGRCLLIEGDPKWQKTIYLISFYTFMHRVFLRLQVKPSHKNWLYAITGDNANHVNGVKHEYNKFIQLLKKLDNEFCGVSGYENTKNHQEMLAMVHGYSGFSTIWKNRNYTSKNLYAGKALAFLGPAKN